MKRIILFAVACVAFTQAQGFGIEDDIKQATEVLKVMKNTAVILFESVRDNYDSVQSLIKARTVIYIQEQTDIQNAAIDYTQNVSRVLTKQAQDAKLPQEVIKCISKEEQAAIATIQGHASKFQTDMLQTEVKHLEVHHKVGEAIKKQEEFTEELFKQGVADLQKCKDKSGIRQVLSKVEHEYIHSMVKLQEIEDSLHSNFLQFEKDAKVLTTYNQQAITLAKNLGEKAMKNCFPKWLRLHQKLSAST